MESPSKIGETKEQCKVCERTTGVYVQYGVYACYQCGIAFREAFVCLGRIEPCIYNQQCVVVEKNVKNCKECRLRKSLDVGMRHNIKRTLNLKYRGGFKTANLYELLATVREAHLETSYLTEPTLDPRMTESMQNVSKSCCALKVVHDATKGVREFARKLFRFGGVPEFNQDTLLKKGEFGVLLVRLARTFNSNSNTLTCWNGQVVVKGQFDGGAELFWKAVFDFTELVHNLNLSDDEVSLFCLVILVNVYYLDEKENLIAEIYYFLFDVLTDLVKNNHPEDSTNFFTVFNILLFRIRYLTNIHKEIKDHPQSPVPHQYTEHSSQFAVGTKDSPTFLGEQRGCQPQFVHQSTASVDRSIPNTFSSILSNPIVHDNPSTQKGFSPSKNPELKRRIAMQTEGVVPRDQDYSPRKGIESQDQIIFEGKKSKRSEDLSGSSTDHSAFCNEGLRNLNLNEHLKQASLANPVNRHPVAGEDSESFPSSDMPMDLTSNSIAMNKKEDYFFDDVSEEPANQEKYIHKKFRSSLTSQKPEDSSTGE